MLRTAMTIAWPSFLVAAAAEMLFFAVVDPHELQLTGPVMASMSRTALYSIGFLGFWALAAASSALTLLLQRPAEELNRQDVDGGRRPGPPSAWTEQAQTTKGARPCSGTSSYPPTARRSRAGPRRPA